MNTVETKQLTKIYKQGDYDVVAVNNASICIEKGEMVAIVGQSGSGKTTLLNLIGGIEKPSSGNVLVDGVDIYSMSDDEMAKIRRNKVGHIFQDYKLIPIFTAEENIAMPLLLDSRPIDKKRIKELAAFLGIEDKLGSYPSQLSGGQNQRVAIARALINKPSIILADEPTGNLDQENADEIMRLLLEINRMGNTVLLVTHEERYAAMCGRKIVMHDGSISN